MIDKLGWLCLKQGKLLAVRSKGQDKFYIPGGKREPGESDLEALAREIKEEVSVDLDLSTVKFIQTFEAAAHGKPDVIVQISLYQANFQGELAANQEIEELAWLDYENKNQCSEILKNIMDFLVSQGLLKIKTHPYDWVLFDADETLFHFDSRGGLELMLRELDLNLSDQDFEQYQALNQKLWKQYELHEITAQELAEKRFNYWVKDSGKTGAELNSLFLQAMAEVCVPIEGAVDLIVNLKKSGLVKLGLISNGFSQLQKIRLEKAGLLECFEFFMTSEEAGIAKPNSEIFEHAFSKMGEFTHSRVLMVGDNYHSDIKGGLGVGIDTCWFNRDAKPLSEGLALPKHQVSSLAEVKHLVINEPVKKC
jgi:putative hydrolase of the HAD superfamily